MIDLRPAASRMAALIDGMDDRQLGEPTPCAATSVGDLVVHVDQVAQGAVALAARDEDGMRAAGAIVADGSRLGPGWRTEVLDHLDAAAQAWTDPAAWSAGAPVPGSDLDATTWGRITLTELVVHAWDLAVATGQRFELPGPTLQVCWDHVRAFVPDAPFPDLWGPPVEVPDGVPLLDRILATTGRDPARWS